MKANGHQPSANFIDTLLGSSLTTKLSSGASVERSNTGNSAAPAAASTPAISRHDPKNARPSSTPLRELTSTPAPPTATAMASQHHGRESRWVTSSGWTNQVSTVTSANNAATAGQSL